MTEQCTHVNCDLEVCCIYHCPNILCIESINGYFGYCAACWAKREKTTLECDYCKKPIGTIFQVYCPIDVICNDCANK